MIKAQFSLFLMVFQRVRLLSLNNQADWTPAGSPGIAGRVRGPVERGGGGGEDFLQQPPPLVHDGRRLRGRRRTRRR